nr:HNH endonuclease signature motif containing protein [Olsenella uli]
MFTLHGPITEKSEAEGAFAFPGFDALAEDDRSILAEIDDGDERRLVKAEQVRREQQDAFRKTLLDAYEGACAITETDVPQVLQAAHINPYRGRKSQIVNNGILLRSDVHLLYDAHLISVEPDTLRISLSERLGSTAYVPLASCRLRLPHDEASHPSRNLLAAHYEQFMQENHVLVA